jgi:hypothetical protein
MELLKQEVLISSFIAVVDQASQGLHDDGESLLIFLVILDFLHEHVQDVVIPPSIESLAQIVNVVLGPYCQKVMNDSLIVLSNFFVGVSDVHLLSAELVPHSGFVDLPVVEEKYYHFFLIYLGHHSHHLETVSVVLLNRRGHQQGCSECCSSPPVVKHCLVEGLQEI